MARLDDRGRYRAGPPEPVGDLGTLLDRLRAAGTRDGPVLLGLDLPLGLPVAYARRAGIDSFVDWFRSLGEGDWRDIYRPAADRSEIALTRPFYPLRPGGTSRAELIEALGLSDWDALYRRCDRPPHRPAAAALFWTLGAQQVGKAALNAWENLLVPAVRAGEVRLWPFEGALPDLLAGGDVVVAETYPGEVYGHLGLSFRREDGTRGGKGNRSVRQANAPALLKAARRLDVRPGRGLRSAIETGFAPEQGGDDAFDAAVGLLGAVNVLRGFRLPGEPDDRVVRQIEGWILGQEADPAA